MPQNIFHQHYDLITPDGKIISTNILSINEMDIVVEIEHIQSSFVGYQIDSDKIFFNIKSTYAQLGVDGIAYDYEFLPKLDKARVCVKLRAFNSIGVELLKYTTPGIYIGKLFAADDRRRVRKKEYLKRLLKKSDEDGNPLLILSEEYKSEKIIEEVEQNRTIARIPLVQGYWIYDEAVLCFIPTITKGLKEKNSSFRKFLFLHQTQIDGERKIPSKGLLLVKTMTMNMKTLFAKVASEELPEGFNHASANVIEPQQETGDIFEFHGQSNEEISHIPLEFYTLEPFREHFFFSDRDFLRECLEKPQELFNAFETAPELEKAAAFVVKGKQLLNLSKEDWIISDISYDENIFVPPRDRKEKIALDNFIQSQALYTILKAMQDGFITSQGIVLSTYFPTPQLKSFLINERVTRCLRAIYFRIPSRNYGDFFSHDDRSLIQDLVKAKIDVFWVDFKYNLLLQYVLREDKNSGVFVPINKVKDFKNATFFGVYGSKLIEAKEKEELKALFQGLLEMKEELDHPLLNPEISIVISTGGGPGVMATGNQIASDLNILSCGHAVDFTKPHERIFMIEEMNPFIQAKMTYRLEHLIVRQAEFSLDFPIFFQGGVGTDFELMLELLRIQVGMHQVVPILLFGGAEYWGRKITSKFQLNRETGTIRGSEWISNTIFCVKTHKEALSIYYKYFTNRLHIGKDYPPSDIGFTVI